MPLVVHFLNVGRGDCAIIKFPSGRVGVIDIDNLTTLDDETRAELISEYRSSLRYLLAANSLQKSSGEAAFIRAAEENITDPLERLDAYIGGGAVFRLLITHPDMDHMTGLARLEQTHRIENFWHTGSHDFNLEEASAEDWENSPYDREDWEAYKRLRASTNDSPRNLHKHQGATGDYWTEDGLELWASTPDLEKTAVEKDKPNILSMVIKLSYKNRAIVLGGDATRDETWPAIYPVLDMGGIDVLKASHHGRKTGCYWPAVKEMAPWLTITSVGEAEHDATETYRRYSQHTVSLRKCGDITITIDDNGKLVYSANIEDHWKPQKT
jgi:beta-lactamase superfamily II metal-dependent hydrolase